MSVARMTRAERREQTRSELLDAADSLFTAHGFHATSVDDVAAEAGYTKGAVYSNFDSKEDLFFGVYERRAERFVADFQEMLASGGVEEALMRAAADTTARRGRDDGWLAVFFEFWAHVIRHPEHRKRFAEIHRRAWAPFIPATEELIASRGMEMTVEPAQFAIAMNAMQVGLSLERLIRPQDVDVKLGTQMVDVILGDGRP